MKRHEYLSRPRELPFLAPPPSERDRERAWHRAWERDGAFRGVSYGEWLMEDIDAPDEIDHEPGLFGEEDVPRIPEHQLAAGKQIVARILADQVKRINDATRAELEPTMDTEEAIAAKLPDGTRLGKVARSKASASVRVTDEQALLEFVTEQFPDELVHSVNPAFLTALKGQVKHGTDIPGLEVVEGSASYRVTPSPDAEGIVLSRMGELLSGSFLAIGGGE